MSQPKKIQQLQGEVVSAEVNVRQTGENLVAAKRDAERLSQQAAATERQIASLEAQNDALYGQLDSLYSQLDSLDDEEDEDGSEAASIESEIASCQAEISANQAQIDSLEEESAALQKQMGKIAQKISQCTQILRGYRQSLQQTDQMFAGHIEERSKAQSGMEQISRLKYGSSARQPAGQLAQDVQTCEQECQKIARLQDEISRYLDDNVKIQGAAAQRGSISGGSGAGRGGAGRTTTGTGPAPGMVPPPVGTPDVGPSSIETAKTTSADFTPPPVVSMAPPGGKSQADVSDIRQMAQENRGKWADAAGFMCAGAAAAGMAAQSAENAPAKEESPLQKRVNGLHEQYNRMEKMREAVDSLDESDDKAVMLNRIAEDFAWKAKEMDAERAPLDEQYQQLMKRYGELANRPETKETRELQHQISQKMLEVDAVRETLKSDSKFFRTHVNEIRRDYPIKTKFVGVRGKRMSECMLSMIPQQGLAVKNFKGTCGCCCIAEAIELLGGSATEAEIVEFARKYKLCNDKKIKDGYSAKKIERIMVHNGGTGIESQKEILNRLGYQCEPKFDQSVDDIYQQLLAGKVAMVGVNHHDLYPKGTKKRSLFAANSTDHMVMVTGIERDENGEPCGLWVHDTGGFNGDRTEVYCSKKDFKKWMKAAGSVVQYVS